MREERARKRVSETLPLMTRIFTDQKNDFAMVNRLRINPKGLEGQ
jgi:hypothetical protein